MANGLLSSGTCIARAR